MAKETKRVVTMGDAGRDFHNFNVAFRDDLSDRSGSISPPAKFPALPVGAIRYS